MIYKKQPIERGIFPKENLILFPKEKRRDARDTKTTDGHCRNKAKDITQIFPSTSHEKSTHEPEHVSYSESLIHTAKDVDISGWRLFTVNCYFIL